jgi:drug/metabolite transporter (DMT)-like permease
MFAALLTTIFYSLSAIFATRSIRAVGAVPANLGRLFVALAVLGAYAFLAGGGFRGAGRDWFVLSGAIGIGIGDLASFAALPLVGSRLTVLMTQCIATPIAMLAERWWLGTILRADQIFWSFLILGGVFVALLPSKKNPPRVPVKAAGFIFGLLAAAGQGIGAVVSRKANVLISSASEPIDGITAAFQRVVGGLVITLAYFAVRALLAKKSAANFTSAVVAPAGVASADIAGANVTDAGGALTGSSWASTSRTGESAPARATQLESSVAPNLAEPSTANANTTNANAAIAGVANASAAPRSWRRWRWVPANAFCGAIIGVSCYQWSLATTPSGIVLPIVATTPLVIVPLSYWLEKEIPTRRSFLGGVIAVTGVVALTLAH